MKVYEPHGRRILKLYEPHALMISSSSGQTDIVPFKGHDMGLILSVTVEASAVITTKATQLHSSFQMSIPETRTIKYRGGLRKVLHSRSILYSSILPNNLSRSQKDYHERLSSSSMLVF